MDKPERDLWNALQAFIEVSCQDLLATNVTASRIKTMQDMLDWKKCDVHAEEKRNV